MPKMINFVWPFMFYDPIANLSHLNDPIEDSTVKLVMQIVDIYWYHI